MTPLYNVELGEPRPDGLTLIRIGFGAPAHNDKLVPAALAAVEKLELTGGEGVLFDGAASLPVAMTLAHAVAHLFQFVACFDPKLGQYVVAISHTPARRPGDLVA